MKSPSLLLSITPILILIGFLFLNVIYFDDLLGGANQIALMITSTISGIIAGFHHVKWNTIQNKLPTIHHDTHVHNYLNYIRDHRTLVPQHRKYHGYRFHSFRDREHVPCFPVAIPRSRFIGFHYYQESSTSPCHARWHRARHTLCLDLSRPIAK